MPVKILVADDAAFVRDMIKRALRNLVQGVELLEAPDGARAKALIKQKQPDLILSDWEMPELSGEELLKWTRENPDSAKTPFVMITSRGDKEHVVAAVQAGVNDYISKPFTAEELTRKVTKQLKKLKIPLNAKKAPAAPSAGFGSLDVLTTSPAPQKASSTPAAAGSLAALGVTASTPSSPTTKPAKGNSYKGSDFKGKAVLRIAGFEPQDYTVREASLQALNGFLKRTEKAPTVFDQAVVDIADTDGSLVATLNAYVHSVQAVEPNPASKGIKVVVRFVDSDPVKMEALSKHLQK